MPESEAGQLSRMSIVSHANAHVPPHSATSNGRSNLVRHNLSRSLGDGASFGAMVGLGETYLPAFALALGLGETAAGLVASLPVVAGGFMQLASLHAMKWFGSEQRWIVLCAAVQALSFIPLVAFAIHGAISLPMLLLIASVYWATGLATGPAWNTWMESIVPVGIRANYFSRRTRLQQAMTLIALLAGGTLLQWAEGRGWVLYGFATLFLAAAASRFVSAVCLALHRTDVRLSNPKGSRGAAVSVSQSGRRLLVYLVTVQAFVQISGPFFAPFMLKQLGFSYTQFVFLMSVAFLARVLAMAMWMRVANHFGAATLFWIGALGLVPISALWIVSSNIAWLSAVQMLSGVVWAAYELGFFLLFFETLPKERRTKMLTLYNFANTLAMFCGAAIGATLLEWLGCTHNAYLVLFGLSGVGRGLALLLLLRTKLKPIPIRSIAIRVIGIRPATATLDIPVLPSIHDRSTTRGDPAPHATCP